MKSGKMRALALVLAVGILISAQKVMPGHDSRVELTVTVAARYGITLEVYDACGQLAGRSNPAVPPARVNVSLAGGEAIGLDVPTIAFGAPAIVKAYLEATPGKRALTAEADRNGAARGLSAVPGRGAIEFTSAMHLGIRTTIWLSYPGNIDAGAVDSLCIFRLDEEEAEWRRLARCGLDPLACSISCEIDDFAVYRVMACTPADLGRFVVFPNPFSPELAPGGAVRFSNLTRDATISIFDVEGRLVWKKYLTDGLGATAWSGTTADGEAASSGIYLFTVTDGRGSTVSGKIALVR